jgi:fumarate hydratase class II
MKLPATQPGSSIMPAKVNPVMCEMLIQACAQVIGNDAAIALGGAFGNFELNVMMPLIAHNLLQSIELLSNGTRVFAQRCVAGLEVDAERCEAMIEQSLAMATALARSSAIRPPRLQSGRSGPDRPSAPLPRAMSGIDQTSRGTARSPADRA